MQSAVVTYKIRHTFAASLFRATCAKCGFLFDTSNNRRRFCAVCRGLGTGASIETFMLRGGDIITTSYALSARHNDVTPHNGYRPIIVSDLSEYLKQNPPKHKTHAVIGPGFRYVRYEDGREQTEITPERQVGECGDTCV